MFLDKLLLSKCTLVLFIYLFKQQQKKANKVITKKLVINVLKPKLGLSELWFLKALVYQLYLKKVSTRNFDHVVTVYK